MDEDVNPKENPETEPADLDLPYPHLWSESANKTHKIFVVVFCKQNFNTRTAEYKTAIKESLHTQEKYKYLPVSSFQVKIVMENSITVNTNTKKKYEGSKHNLEKSPWSLFFNYLLNHTWNYDIVLLVEDDVDDTGNHPIKFGMSENICAFNTSLNMLLRWYEFEERHPGPIKSCHHYIIQKNHLSEPSGIISAGEVDGGEFVVELV